MIVPCCTKEFGTDKTAKFDLDDINKENPNEDERVKEIVPIIPMLKGMCFCDANRRSLE